MKLGTMTRSGPLLTIDLDRRRRTARSSPMSGLVADDLTRRHRVGELVRPLRHGEAGGLERRLRLVEGPLRDVRDLHRRVALAHGQRDRRVGRHFGALRRDRPRSRCRPAPCRRIPSSASPSTKPCRASAFSASACGWFTTSGIAMGAGPDETTTVHRLAVGERAAVRALGDDRAGRIGRVLLFGDVDVESLLVRPARSRLRASSRRGRAPRPACPRRPCASATDAIAITSTTRRRRRTARGAGSRASAVIFGWTSATTATASASWSNSAAVASGACVRVGCGSGPSIMPASGSGPGGGSDSPTSTSAARIVAASG